MNKTDCDLKMSSFAKRIFAPWMIAIAATIAMMAACPGIVTCAHPAGTEVNLLALPKISMERLPDGEKEPALLFHDEGLLPYDAAANTYYLTSAESAKGVFVRMEEGWQGFIASGKAVEGDLLGNAAAGGAAAETLMENATAGGKMADSRFDTDGFGLYVTNGTEWEYSRVIVTRLPVLCLSQETGMLEMVQSYSSGKMFSVQTPAAISVRGNTSQRFPKKSYKLKLLDENGKKRDLSLAGLRTDDDWILNPMYSDTSKIREALGYWLWDEMNSSGQAAASSSVVYVEVIFDGAYHGLYGLQERVDRKQVKGNKWTDVLYKIAANDRPSVEELLSCRDAEACRGLELSFAGSIVEDPWACAADYMAILDGTKPPYASQISVANTIDYGLWAMLLQARDCHFKNQFVHCVWENDHYMLYRIPWDLNHTLGDLWNGTSGETNYLEYGMIELTMDDCFERFLAQGGQEARQAVRQRWNELRSGWITEEYLTENANRLFSSLYPSILRDSERWPECGMGEGNAANIRDIEDFFHNIIPRIDSWALDMEGSRAHRVSRAPRTRWMRRNAH